MVSLFFILFLAITVFLVVKPINCDHYKEELKSVCFISCVISMIFFIWVFALIITIATEHTIDDKISMYESENALIKESIDVTVKNYIDFETTTYAKFKDEDSLNLVSLFPELKSDTLVQQQITAYIENKQKIKELKEEKIDMSKEKFKLYFGR